MNSWEQLIVEFPQLKTAWDILIIVVPLTFLLAYSGIFFISAIAKIVSVVRKRSIYDKCARQTAKVGMITGWLLLIGIRAWLYYEQTGNPEDLDNFLRETSWLLLSIGVFIGSIYFCLWRVLKNMPVLLSTIGMIAAIQNCLALALILCTTRYICAVAASGNASMTLPDIFPQSWGAPLYSIMGYTLPLIFALGGALGACWLLLMRKREDFGRDYYNAMMPWCLKWSACTWGILWLWLAGSTAIKLFPLLQAGAFTDEIVLIECAYLLIWLLPLLMWITVLRASLPLRQRWLVYLGALIACGFTWPYFLELTSL